MKKRLALYPILGVGLSLGACQEAEQKAPSPPSPAPTVLGKLSAGPEEKLVDVFERTHFAFRSENGEYVAGHLTHDAVVTTSGLRFTPRHWDGSQTIVGAPVQLATRSISRGDVELDSNIHTTGIRDGGVELDRATGVERFENYSDGVEQSWAFTQAPDGEGDLAVRVAVTGFAQVTTTTTGVHFLTPGKLGIRYSNAVWRDHNGESWNVPATWDGHDLVVTVPQNVLTSSVFPAVLDPTVTAEAAVDSLTTGDTGDFARELGVSFSGTQYLVVWRDDRNGNKSDIYGTRVGTDGSIVDKYGLPINRNTGTETTPVVAWAGSRWVVAWNDGGDIGAATVTGQGTIAQLGMVAATAATESNPSIAGVGNAAVLVWQSDTDVRGALFNATTFGAPFDVAATANTEADPSVAASPSGYLVTWTEGTTANDIRGQLLTTGGALSGVSFTVSGATGAQTEPTSSFNGTNYVVGYTNAGTDTFAVRVDLTGTVLDATPVAITQATGSQITPAVACTGSGSCLFLWGDRRAINTNGSDIYGQVVDGTLAKVGAEIPVATQLRNQLAPALASGSSGWFGAWEDGRTGGSSVAMASRFDTNGALLDTNGIVLNRGYNSERAPAYASSASTGSLAVWSDSRSLGNDIEGIRYSASGGALEGTAKTISNATAEQADPSASFDGAHYLVVWRDGRNATDDIYASRFDQSTGTAMDPSGIAISTAADRQLVPDIASGNSVSLVVWQDRRNAATTGFDIYGALVNQSGTIVLNDIAISNATGDQVRPAVTYDPADNVFVVVWSDPRNGGVADIYGARVDTSGTVLDTAGVQISGAANGQFSPDIAVSGNQLLAIWDDRRNEAVGDVYGTRLMASGSLSVLDTNGIAIATTGGQSEPTVTGTQNGRWVVAWSDTRNSTTTQTDLYGNDITTAGVVGSEFVITNGPEDEHAPAFQNDPPASGGLKIPLVYQKLRTDINTQRVYKRVLTYSGDTGTTCTMNSQCATGFCVDGYCCDAACGGTQATYPRDCQACSVARGAAVNGTCGVVAAGTLCRWYDSGSSTDTYCDVTEVCDGASTVCPSDVGRHQGLACTGLCGTGTCPANDTTGAPHVCVCP